MLTEDEMVTQLLPSLEDEEGKDDSGVQLQASYVPMPIDKKGSTLLPELNSAIILSFFVFQRRQQLSDHHILS